MSEAVRYAGDIDAQSGKLRDFLVGLGKGVNGEVLKLLKDVPGIQISENAEDADLLLVRSATKLKTSEDFENFPALKGVIRVGSGTDNIDTNAAVPYINTPGANVVPVAERAWAFIQDHIHGITAQTELLREFGQNGRGWQKGETRDPTALRLGVIGFGRIGKEMAEIAGKGRVRSITCYEPHDASATEERRTLHTDQVVTRSDSLEDLVSQSSVISIHVPCGDRPVLTSALLAMVNPGTLIINTARAETIDLDGLFEAMDRGVLYSADVHPVEEKDKPWPEIYKKIVTHPNFRGTLHSAASAIETQEALLQEGVRLAMQIATVGMWPQALNMKRGAELQERETPGHRLVYLHSNTPGAINAITKILQDHQLNIESQVNTGGPNIAVTAIDLNGDSREEILAAHRAILALTNIVHQGRMMAFEQPAPGALKG